MTREAPIVKRGGGGWVGECARGMRVLYALGVNVRKSRRGLWEQGEGEVACVSVSECMRVCGQCRGATTSMGVGLDRSLGKRAGQLGHTAATGGRA